MIISLVGMSGSGKSHWSKQLVEKGFRRFGVDDLIADKLGVADVSSWMGLPYEERYPKNSRKYLELENQILEEILSSLPSNQKVVIDTTGSVIYTRKELLERMKKMTKVVYLETPKEAVDEMLSLFMREPKPVIWGKEFEAKLKRGGKEALKKYYPALLEWRSKKYNSLSELTLNYYLLRNSYFGAEEFLELLG